MYPTSACLAVALLFGASIALNAHAQRSGGVTPSPSSTSSSSLSMSAARVSSAGRSVASGPAPAYVPPPPKPAVPAATPTLQPHRPSPMSPPTWRQPELKRPDVVREGSNRRPVDVSAMSRRDHYNARSIGGAADVNRRLQERAYRAAQRAETAEGQATLKTHKLVNDKRNNSPLLPEKTAKAYRSPTKPPTLDLVGTRAVADSLTGASRWARMAASG
jgi:hypothetical protein